MDALVIYAITAGGILLALVFVRFLSLISKWKSPIWIFIYRHIIYPNFISRHTFWGPWSRVGVFAHLMYVTVNSILFFFRSNSLEDVGGRAGGLSLLSMILLLRAGHLSYAADLLGVSLTAYRNIHRAPGWMIMILAVLHVGAFCPRPKKLNHWGKYTKSGHHNFACLGALTLMSLLFVRKLSYEFFHRTHQGVLIVTVYGIWQHVPKDELLPWLYVIIRMGVASRFPRDKSSSN